MYPIIRRFVLAALILGVLCPTVASAKSSPEAMQWLDKFIQVYEQGPFSTAYTASIQIPDGDQPVDGSMKGNLTYRDETHLRMELTMVLSGMPGAPSGGSVEMEMLAVNDGEQTWTEVNMPALGMQQVMKISLEDAKSLQASQGGAGAGPAAMDPVQQLRQLAKTLDFQLVKVEGGEVHLHAPITEASRGGLGQMGALPGLDALTLVLDESTGFPKRSSMGGDEPLISIEFDAIQPLDEKSLDAGLFTYEPPEGVQVMDLGALAGAQPATVDQ